MVDSSFSVGFFDDHTKAVVYQRRNLLLACLNRAICPTDFALAFGRSIRRRSNQGGSSPPGNPNLGRRQYPEI